MPATPLVLATVLSYVAGWLADAPRLVPVFNTLASYPFMVAALWKGDLRLAITRMLLWAMTLAVCATLLSYARPWQTDSLFLRGGSYRAEMFTWVLTGRGDESRPARFIPQQALHVAIFVTAAVATGGVLAMAMGAVLMNQMGHYVGALAAASAHPVLVMVLGWHPWSVIRIASFVTIGVVLSAPLLSAIGGFPVDWRAARRFLSWAGAGLVIDVVLKSLLAPVWQRLLLRLTGW